MTAAPAAVIVMAKAPLPGLAKTRLVPALGLQGAARLAERLLRAAVAEAVAAQVGPVTLCVTPDRRHPVFTEMQLQHGVRLADQCPGDLGARMAHALAQGLAGQRAAVLIGTDAPALDAAYLRHAAAALATHDAVFGPAEDGGYVLVGLRRPAPALFEDMRWSHARVMQDTRERLAALGLRHAELPVLADIDEVADLRHLPPAWRGGAGP